MTIKPRTSTAQYYAVLHSTTVIFSAFIVFLALLGCLIATLLTYTLLTRTHT